MFYFNVKSLCSPGLFLFVLIYIYSFIIQNNFIVRLKSCITAGSRTITKLYYIDKRQAGLLQSQTKQNERKKIQSSATVLILCNIFSSDTAWCTKEYFRII